MGDPEPTYGRFSIQIWQDKLQAELHASGIPGAIHKLTKSMANIARTKALLREADTIVKLLQEMSDVQEYVLFLLWFAFILLSPSDESSLGQSGSKPNTTPQKEAMIKRLRYLKPFWIRGVG